VLAGSHLGLTDTLKIKALCSLNIQLTMYWLTQPNIPEDLNLQSMFN
jgi:hypothetical protein